jgi:hypothetical protein
MTLEQYMAANGGYWDGDFAMVSQGTYVRNLAVRHGDKIELSEFGKGVVANTLAGAVQSPKRQKKAAVPAPVYELDDLDLGD